MVSKEIIAKFKTIYQEKFNIILTDEKATQMANDLVNLMRVLLKPDLSKENIDTYNHERRQDEIIET